MHWILPEARILQDLFRASETTARLRITVSIGIIRHATGACEPDGEASTMQMSRGRRAHG
jgi:hypothetical protein